MRTAFLLLVFTATALQGWAQNAENRQISLEMKFCFTSYSKGFPSSIF